MGKILFCEDVGSIVCPLLPIFLKASSKQIFCWVFADFMLSI